MANEIQYALLALQVARRQQVEMGEEEAAGVGFINNNGIRHDRI